MARLMVSQKSATFILLRFAILAIICWSYSCNSEVKNTPTEQAADVAEKAGASGQKTDDVQKTAANTASNEPSIKRKMACGAEINIPANGTLAQLLDMIDDPSMKPNKDNWMSMDQLEFKEGATLDMAKSVRQMINMAAVLKCYPNLQLKFGAYSDGAGKADENTKLAFARAEAVKATLIGLGAPPASLQSEGFGNKTQSDTDKAAHHRVVVQIVAK